MTDPLTLRLMTVDDVEEAMAVIDESQASRDPDRPRVAPSSDEWQSARLAHARFVELDGPGAWVALSGNRIVGVAEAIRRGDFWGLSMLFVHPDFQSIGVGRRLLNEAMGYGADARVRMIQSSPDPRAIRRYALAGLAMYPTGELGGLPDRKAIPTHLGGRSGSADDLELVEKVEEGLQRSRADDVAFTLRSPANHLEVVDQGAQRGWVLWNPSRLIMLGATDKETATTLMWRYIAEIDGEAVANGLTAEQNWAFDVAHAAHLTVRVSGAMFIDGMAVPGPWIPSGWHF
jgi:GNAT superfamily N-acetyltransferase